MRAIEKSGTEPDRTAPAGGPATAHNGKERHADSVGVSTPYVFRGETAAGARGRARDSEMAASHGFRASPAGEMNDRDPAIARAVVRAKSGDMDAIRFLYLRYKNNVYGYILSIVRDAHEAEDATQTVFLKLISVIHKYEPRQAPFTAWILRVAHNVAIDSLRQRRPVPCEEVIESSHPADDVSHDRRRGLEQALETLPEDQRDVVLLRNLVGLSPAEIADRMGRSESSVHGLHHRARRALRRELVRVECAPTTRTPNRGSRGAAG
jgi:RNA polymerase sigma-70 factor, ECF subfamily